MDFRRFDLNLLLVLDALFDEASATAVARRLRISQPTVSFSLAKLRDVFQDPLFIRTRNGMRPTPVALELRAGVRDAIEIIEHRVLPSSEFDPGTSRRNFRISTSDIGELCFLPDLMEAIRIRAPDASLTNILLPPEDLQRALETGDVDVATGYFPDLKPPAFARQELFDHPFIVIARTDHPLAARPLTREAFLAAEHAVVTSKGRSQELFERTMRRLGLERRVVLTTPHFMSLPFLIARSDLIATVPRAVGTAFEKIVGLALLPPPVEIPSIMLAQHWHRRHELKPANQWLRSLVSALFLGRDPTRRDEKMNDYDVRPDHAPPNDASA